MRHIPEKKTQPLISPPSRKVNTIDMHEQI